MRDDRVLQQRHDAGSGRLELLDRVAVPPGGGRFCGAGLRAGAARVRAAGNHTDVRLIACAERDLPIDDTAMDAFITAWELGLIVGVDRVGPELGHPAATHAEQF
ncbi:hypothetical protein [Actinomadura formosensis]|uniref:hypothetical protein n=1 Tax=Actinomadura formosensis TaxID=60706 RepID=UPI003D900A5D